MVEKISVPKIILFMEIKDSFEKETMFLLEVSNGSLYENIAKDKITKIPAKLSKYNPLSGSLANE